MLIINAYFLSKLNYGIELFGSANANLLHKLQVKQNRALKILFNKDYYTPTTKLHLDLKVLKVSDAYKYSISKFVYKQQANLLPCIFDNQFTRVGVTHDHATRQQELLKIENTTHKTKHSEKLSTTRGILMLTNTV